MEKKKPRYIGLLKLILIAHLLVGCHQHSNQNKMPHLPRIAIAGIAIESSTFSPAVTHIEAFNLKYGDEVFSFYPFLSADSLNRNRAEWLPTLRGHAMPGGIVTRDAYEQMVGQTLEMLAEMLPLDGLFFDIHGAMSVVGLDDPEGDFIERIRQVIGFETIISTCMDLHGSVSWRLAQNTDLITCFRMAPHEDFLISKQRAVENLLERIEGGKGKPKYKAWIPIPILLPGEKTSTRVEPAKSLYELIEPATAFDGVIDASIWMSYPWADEPRNHAVVMVVGDNQEQTSTAAESIARFFWEVRNQFGFVAPTDYLHNCIDLALQSTSKPFIISDMGDNPTAGGAGDVTWTLAEILSRKEFQASDGPILVYASLPDKEFVKKAVELGIGATIKAPAGANIDNRFAQPVKLNGKIKNILHGDTRAQTEVVVQVGNIHIIVTKYRKPYHLKSDFVNLGIDPKQTDILVVKIGYLVPELYEMKGGWIMALTPGGVDQDLLRLEYKRINRPMFPLDKDMDTPDLKTRFVPLSGKN